MINSNMDVLKLVGLVFLTYSKMINSNMDVLKQEHRIYRCVQNRINSNMDVLKLVTTFIIIIRLSAS